ncbi:polysaccharide pyruvyl transferase family protein [Metabacillus rhizolycopersici]|uniref:Polysaccharide pyruvyl transferase family protein n=1 Tax=Metabacillus rhizolycopersici TaxID=2875709 RepID=A0ABS7UP08_9BACI|nr:polysaccharide pyruvyl transferase family protein [Metabacillus rhizolycopersici]MBZ5749695.1 polysaccharide pyruvyl transferase family protein [Metabacillus rhizolycopersici]
MKKIFVDIYLQFNLGDDLFLDILAKKFPNSEFTINYLGNNYDQFISQYNNVKRRKYSLINKIGQRLKISDSITNYDTVAIDHDALLFIGGSIFREEDYHHTLYQDRIKMIKEFKNRGKSVFILGSNFGPFKSAEFLNDYKELFKLCDDVCFRDLYSFKLFKSLPQVRHAPDIVFQMEINDYKTNTDQKRIGFSIIDVRHKKGLSKYHNDYISSTVKSIESFVSKGYECCLMSFCEQEGDLQVINEIKSILSTETLNKVFIYEYKGKLKEAIALIASFNLFIAARFHANILALLLGIGLMPIIYSDKTTNMFKDINLIDVLVNMNELYLQFDENTFNRSLNNKIDLEMISNDAKNQFSKLSKFLNQDNIRGII